MAEGDEPAMGVLPPELMEPVSISHPDYEEGFEKLDLKWVKAPALSRPGFGKYFQALLDIHQLKLKF